MQHGARFGTFAEAGCHGDAEPDAVASPHGHPVEEQREERDGYDSGPGGVHGVIPRASESSSPAIFFAETPCDRASATSWRRRRRNRLSASRSAAGARRSEERRVGKERESWWARKP